MTPTPREILDTAAATRIPDSLDLLTSILERASAQNRPTEKPNHRSTLMQTLRAKPALLILFVLLALSLLSGVVYAVSRTLGYLPGVGIVEQGAPIRVLAAPVAQTRDAITVTVTSVTLASDKTVVTYAIENVPWEALSHQEDIPGCLGQEHIRLPDGSLLTSISGGGSVSADGKWETRLVYAAIPPEINEAEFLLDCIPQTLPGKAPENWRLPLRFVPAPPDLTVLPVVEIATPTPAPTLSVETPISPAPPFQITQALQVEDNIVILGRVIQPAQGWIQLHHVHVTDASGQPVFVTPPTLDGLPDYDWGVQFKAGPPAPFTLTFEGVVLSTLTEAQAEMMFDAGASPSAGQEWILNQPIEIGGRMVTLVSISTDGVSGYSFQFSADSDVMGLSVAIDGSDATGSGGGGAPGQFFASLMYDTLPTGSLRLRLSNLTLASPLQTWNLPWNPDLPAQPESLYGIRLVLDQFIPLDDGYYLIGHTEASDGRILKAAPADWMTATDASGQRLALEMASFSEVMQLVPALDESTWVYRLRGKAFQGNVTLRLGKVNVSLAQPVPLTLDLRPYNVSAWQDMPPGAAYKTGLIPLNLPGLSAQLYRAAAFQQGDLRGFELAFDADPRLDGIVFEMEFGGSAMSNSYRDPQSGVLLIQVATDPAPPMPFPLTATGLRLRGDWTVDWTPPAPPPGATPVYAPQACLTLDTVKQALANPPALPPGLTGKLLLSRGALYPDPSLFRFDLNDRRETPLVFGNGSLSPDGAKLVYADQQDRIAVLDIAARQITLLTSGQQDLAPRWSPDSAWIAFQRITPKGQNIFVMPANGSAPRQLTDQTGYASIAGWTTDGNSLLIQDGASIELLSIADGARRVLLQTEYDPYGAFTAALSPDGNWLAYLEKVPGAMAPGIYLKALPNGEPRLLAQLEHWMPLQPVFSPDSRWLALGVMNTDLPDTPVATVLVPLGGLTLCPAYPLPISGIISEWRP